MQKPYFLDMNLPVIFYGIRLKWYCLFPFWFCMSPYDGSSESHMAPKSMTWPLKEPSISQYRPSRSHCLLKAEAFNAVMYRHIRPQCLLPV